jgi:ATP-dependent Lon protease
MEIIHLPGYLDFEKAMIGKDYLLPKQLTEIGLKKSQVGFKEDAFFEIIRFYTRESGVRELERQISSVLRKIAVFHAEGKAKAKTVTGSSISTYLGPRKYVHTTIKTKPTIGYAVGLAWTEVGGEVLPVEVAPMHGKAKLTLTGSLGEIMRESATAGLAFIRRQAHVYGLKEDFFENLELHVHIPEGAVPKEGPSAGVTLVTAILSSLTNIPVKTNIAMTGEVTLTGDVLPIGGLNEKLLAAKRYGITHIILPDQNKKDLSELPPELLEGLKLEFVSHVDQVLNLAMIRSPKTVTKHRATHRPGVRPA